MAVAPTSYRSANDLYQQCKVQAEYHRTQYMNFLSYAKYYYDILQHSANDSSYSSYKPTNQTNCCCCCHSNRSHGKKSLNCASVYSTEESSSTCLRKRKKKRKKRNRTLTESYIESADSLNESCTENEKYHENERYLEYYNYDGKDRYSEDEKYREYNINDNYREYNSNDYYREYNSNDNYGECNNDNYRESDDIKTEGEEEYIEETEEFEVDPAFKEFLKISAEFRKERDAARLREQENEEKKDGGDNDDSIEYVDLMRKGPEGTILPPTASNRKALYEAKYGALKGTTILSLETALQWNFNKFTDSKSPKPWPALPLKL